MYQWNCPRCLNMNLSRYEVYVHKCEHCGDRYVKEEQKDCKNAMEQDSSRTTD